MDDFKAKRNLVAGVFAAVLLADACSSSADERTLPSLDQSNSTTTASMAPPSTTETSVVETAFADMERPELEVETEWDSDLDEIFGRYLMYWEALDIASGPPFADPDYQPLLDLLDPGLVSDVQSQLLRSLDTCRADQHRNNRSRRNPSRRITL